LLEYTTLAWNDCGGENLDQRVETEAREGNRPGLDCRLHDYDCADGVVWQIRGVDLNRERPALQLIGGAFSLLAVYVLVQASYTLSSGIHPAPSRTGIIWLILTVLAMLLLAWGKLLTGRQLGNP